MNFVWHFEKEAPSGLVELLQEQLRKSERYPKPLANWLVNKGIQNLDSAKEWMCPSWESFHSPWEMKGMAAAVQRIEAAIQKEEKILLYGDYDVDGTCSVAMMSLFFSEKGVPTQFYIPDRFSEGYGLSYQGIEFASTEGVSLLITLDCGTKSLDKIRLARERGIDVIVCDHHEPGPELPGTVALLNPKQKGCAYPFKELSACGVAFKLLAALNGFPKGNRDEIWDVAGLEKFLDLVCLSTACDLVPMEGENRLFVWHGLKKLVQNPLPGPKALMQLEIRPKTQLEVEDLVFSLGPKINSAGRLGHASDAVRLLLGDPTVAEELAKMLTEKNVERRLLDRETTLSAIGFLESDPHFPCKNATIAYEPEWSKGVVGIVASRLVERYYRPTLVLTQSGGFWVGSGRSVHDFDLHEALEQCAEYLVQFGGHRYAAGLTLRPENLAAFSEAFEQAVQSKISPSQKAPILEIAFHLDFAYLNPKFIRLLKRLGPFGPGCLEPVFWVKNAEVLEATLLQKEHLRLLVKQDGRSFEAIGFGLAEKWSGIEGSRIDLAFRVDEKTWKNRTHIQLKIKDFRQS